MYNSAWVTYTFENVPCYLTCLIELDINLLRKNILVLRTNCSTTGHGVERDVQCLSLLSVTCSADVTELLPFRNASLTFRGDIPVVLHRITNI